MNTKNGLLVTGGGTDRAVREAAGSVLLDGHRKLNGCETGEY